MAKLGADTTVLDFNDIDKALDRMNAVKTYSGRSGLGPRQSLSPSTKAVRYEISDAINNWKQLDPADFHTAEGFDALKRQIGDIRDAQPFGTPERVAANEAYSAIRSTIVKQAPEYAKIMKGYEEASKQISEIERTLSLNPKAPIDTSLRKLQSVLRNNVNTSYGRRAALADYLTAQGAPHLMERLSGQALNTWMPRGLGRLAASLGTEAVLGTAAAVGAHALPALAPLPFMSPRLMGEAAYLSGRAASPLKRVPVRPIGRAAFQAGRLANNPFAP
jgi:hypothetical protein